MFGLTVTRGSVTLRLPTEDEAARLAGVAAEGVHAEGERPFLTPWTERGARSRSRFVLQERWRDLADWRVDAWRLGLGVFVDDEPVGVVTLRARAFPVAREVTTSSWLGLAHQGRGLGTKARLGVLALAFDHLGAAEAITEVFQDNAASQGVSRKLGYRPDGISRDVRDGEVVVSDRLRLRRADWEESRHGEGVSVTGLEQCGSMFGLEEGSSRPDSA
jgi:RimJ/RimL family protein N-acetyltransferase